MEKFIAFVIFIFISVPVLTLANGGDQRVVDGKYLINLSRAPFTPYAGAQTSMIASFVDIQKDKLIAEDLLVKVRIAKFDDRGTQEFLFEKQDLTVKGGILELAYTFAESGIHEIFFDFAFAASPEVIYKAPDFLLDVQEQKNPAPVKNIWPISLGAGITGIIAGFLLSRLKLTK